MSNKNRFLTQPLSQPLSMRRDYGEKKDNEEEAAMIKHIPIVDYDEEVIPVVRNKKATICYTDYDDPHPCEE